MPEPLPVKAQGKLLPEDRSAAPLICSSALVHQVRDWLLVGQRAQRVFSLLTPRNWRPSHLCAGRVTPVTGSVCLSRSCRRTFLLLRKAWPKELRCNGVGW